MSGAALFRLVIPALLALAMLAGCMPQPRPDTTRDHARASGIGPYASLQGRLIVIEPHRRWQVWLQWQAQSPAYGNLRLTHAASQTIIELRWQDKQMELRSNGAPQWRPVSIEALAEEGIVLAPWDLARLLLGDLPDGFAVAQAKNGESGRLWETPGQKPFIRIQWQPEHKRLRMTDMTHGRMATLIITDARAAAGP